MPERPRSRKKRPKDELPRLKSIGVVHSPYKNPKDIPPPAFAPPGFFERSTGEIIVFEDFAQGLENLEGFSHIIVLFAFHKVSGFKLMVTPPGESRPRGVFATRSPHRPNPLGLSILRLLGREASVLKVADLDIIDGTPVLDIKPYTQRDRKARIRTGWLKDRTVRAR